MGNPTAKGFHPVICQVCNDHSPRAGFIIQPESVGYNCFNCKAVFKYQELSGQLSKSCKSILHDFGFSYQELDNFSNALWFHNKGERYEEITTLESLKQVKLDTPEISLPSKCIQLSRQDKLANPFITYLENRKIDWQKLRCLYSLDEKFANRIVIPVYRNNKVIYWQARTIGAEKPKYKMAYASREAVLWGYNNFFNDNKVLFLTEGIFNASHVNGVALLSSTISPAQKEILTKVKKDKVVIVDRDENGVSLASQALAYGWKVALLPNGANDVNHSVTKFGIVHTVHYLMTHIMAPSMQTEMELKFYV
jgi:DNA primase